MNTSLRNQWIRSALCLRGEEHLKVKKELLRLTSWGLVASSIVAKIQDS